MANTAPVTQYNGKITMGFGDAVKAVARSTRKKPAKAKAK